MNNFNNNNRSNQGNSMELLGAVLSDGTMAGLTGGILGSVLPVIALFTRNSSMASLGFFVNIFLYAITGILAGYLLYSRKIRIGGTAAMVGITGGLLAGLISGAATGIALSQVSLVMSQANVNIPWVMWSILSALGAGFIGALTAWIPGFFLKSGNTATYRTNNQTSRISTKGTGQHETTGNIFERRRRIRFVVTMTIIALMCGSYFCRLLSQ